MRVVGENNDGDIDFTITDSQLIEGNDSDGNRETEPFVDFIVSDSRTVDSEDGIETINIMMDNDICIPNTNIIGRDTSPPKRKRIVTSHLTQAVRAAEKIKKKYKQKRMGKKAARISTDDSRFKQENKKAAEWLKDNGFLDDSVPAEKADVGETTDLKKTRGASIAAKNIVKKYRNLARKKPYGKRPARIFTEDNNNNVEDIVDLVDIVTLKPNKNAQIAAKKITENIKTYVARKMLRNLKLMTLILK